MIDLLSTREMAEADRLAIAGGVPGIELMENAGRAVADCVGRRGTGGSVVVLAGPGNNGGDGYVAARLLAERGYPVRVLHIGEWERLNGDAAEAAERWTGPLEPATPLGLSGAEIIVDALFGAGLDRPVEGQARQMIEAVNGLGAYVVAVDLPSGINGNSGAVMGVAVKAAETVTFFRRKPGHLLLPGRLHCGRLEVADIGIPRAVLNQIRPQTTINEPALWQDYFPVPRLEGHKYSRGHTVVLSGGAASTGAARLAARGALRAGSGLVTIASPKAALAVNAAANLAVMVRPVDGAPQLAAFLADERRNAVVLGPGGGVGLAMRQAVFAALKSKAAVILDADALTSFDGSSKALATAIAKRKQVNTVLTPHEGEFIRLFSKIKSIINVKVKLEKARLAAYEMGGILVLKGPDTVVAAPDGRAAIAANAPPWLATAGSGDVLAGMIAGLMAQGMPGFEAASAAVWLHGEAANRFGVGLIAEDLPEQLPGLYRTLLNAIARHAGGEA